MGGRWWQGWCWSILLLTRKISLGFLCPSFLVLPFLHHLEECLEKCLLCGTRVDWPGRLYIYIVYISWSIKGWCEGMVFVMPMMPDSTQFFVDNNNGHHWIFIVPQWTTTQLRFCYDDRNYLPMNDSWNRKLRLNVLNRWKLSGCRETTGDAWRCSAAHPDTPRFASRWSRVGRNSLPDAPISNVVVRRN